MRITRHNESYTLRCTENEFSILQLAVGLIEADDAHTMLGEYNDSRDAMRLRKTWSRRVGGGDFLRIDKDRRTV